MHYGEGMDYSDGFSYFDEEYDDGDNIRYVYDYEDPNFHDELWKRTPKDYWMDWYVLELLFILNKSNSKHFIQEFWIQI